MWPLSGCAIQAPPKNAKAGTPLTRCRPVEALVGSLTVGARGLGGDMDVKRATTRESTGVVRQFARAPFVLSRRTDQHGVGCTTVWHGRQARFRSSPNGSSTCGLGAGLFE